MSDVISVYFRLGFEHILPRGTDHVLFVLGLFLLSAQLKPLLLQVTTFTVAHAATLVLSTYGLVSLPPAIVEPLIALSIAYIAIENIVVREFKPRRLLVVFAFGLLHGLGFAGALASLGLPPDDFLPALLAFNLGVEVGQIVVVLAALCTVGLFSRRPWYRERVVVSLSMLVGLIGAYWTFARIAGA
jgi:hypothetical protein